jgi:hypothetical protein
MSSSPPTWTTSWPAGALPLGALLLEDQLRRARTSPSDFAEFCFADAAGRPLRQAPVHRALQDFLTAHAHALVELPRDHGKSVQACVRVLWELGRDPGHVHPGQQELFDEMTTFPFAAHDDLLDAAATGAAYLLDRPEPRVW